ncbi:MAG: two-component regulator propeller domain-containing protein, partial [Ignavibacteriaceae bacterium]
MLLKVKHYIIYFYVLLVAAILFNISTPAQNKTTATTNWPEPVFEQLTIADGLPENSVYAILQDRFGYLWLGTQNGLVRYDGYSMKVYTRDPDDSLSISDRTITAIYEDRSGTLWIGTGYGGLNRFDRKTETFTRYMHNPDDSVSIQSNNVYCIGEDKKGNILVGSSNGLSILNQQTKKFKYIGFETSKFTKTFYDYVLSQKEKNKTLCSILKVGNNVNLSKSFRINKKTTVLITNMGEGGCDFGWLEDTNGKIISEQKYTKTVNAGRFSNNQIQVSIDTLESGEYKLCYTSDFSWAYNSWSDKPPDYPEHWGIQVIELDENQKKISELLTTEKRLIQNYKVADILDDSLTGNIYVSSENKILLYDTEKELLTQIDNIPGLENELGIIQSFYQAKDGTIWIGHSRGLAMFSSLNNTIRFYKPVTTQNYNIDNYVNEIIEDDDGLIWGLNARKRSRDLNGLICFNPQREIFKIYKYEPENKTSLSGDRVWSIYKDRSGI